jgi:CBS domain containing-hemolysin-like protein
MLDFFLLHRDLIITAICLLVLAVISMAEAALVSVNKVRLRHLAETGNLHARLVDRLTDDRHILLTALVITINACLLAASAFITRITIRLVGEHWVPLVSLAMILIILAFFEVTPKAIGLRHAERLAFFFARPVIILIWLLSPFIWLLTKLGRALIRALLVPLFGGQVEATGHPFTEEEIKQLISVGQEEGELEEEEKQMLHSAIEFADKVAREVMVPRPDMVCLPEDATVSEAVEVGMESGFSRIPVYRRDLDHIVGILYMRDLLPWLIENATETKISALMRPPYRVPESKRIDDLLREMQGRRVHIAIVMDEYGGVAGLVSIEDLLEEIVGEIRDEYDSSEEEPLRMLDDNTAIALARISPDDIAKKFFVPLPEGEFDTLGGFLTEQLGRIPEVGEEIEYGPLLFVIEKVGEQRIETVRITRREEQAEDETEERPAD